VPASLSVSWMPLARPTRSTAIPLTRETSVLADPALIPADEVGSIAASRAGVLAQSKPIADLNPTSP
jgi:hypothetical protein